MVLAGVFKSIARAGKQGIAKNIGGHDDKHLAFLPHYNARILHTLAAAPDQVSSTTLTLEYDHAYKRLKIDFSDGHTITFVFREDDIMVLSSEPFSYDEFKEKLSQSLGRF